MIRTRLEVAGAVADGTHHTGMLIRRADALVFIPAHPLDDPMVIADLADSFLGAASSDEARDIVTSTVLDLGLRVEPFLFVGWHGAVSVLALGDVELTSDLPTLPMLSGRGSASWVEHRAPSRPARNALRAGASPTPGTDLILGCVPADGFVLHVDTSDADDGNATDERGGPEPAVSIATLTATPVPVAAASTTAAPATTSPVPPAPATTLPIATPTRASDSAPAPGDHRADGWRALQAAVGGDWMEDSLGLPPADRQRLTAAAVVAEPEIDPEITLDPADFAASTGPAADPADPDVYQLPPPGDAAAADGGRPMLQARRCPRQHVNPLAAALCRQCREPVDPRAAVELVPQPGLGSLVLPNGLKLVIDGPIVIGRRPDPTAARVDHPSAVHALDVGNDVSRTHLVVQATGWTIEAVDCGSSGHTVVVPVSGREPIELQPWVPHELAHGDTLYLGGPTALQVVA